jgi:DNA-directed RNA polymerase subunit M/transcription elongation factor TFIIS
MANDRPVGMKFMTQSNPSHTYNLFCQDCKSIFYVTVIQQSTVKHTNEPEQVKDDESKKSKNLLCPDCDSSNLWLWELL